MKVKSKSNCLTHVADAVEGGPISSTSTPMSANRQGVKHQPSVCWDAYIGTKEAIVAAGIAPDGTFPGDPGRRPTSCSYYRDWTPRCTGRGKADISIQRRGKKFEVWIATTSEVRQARKVAEEQKDEWRKKAIALEAEVKKQADRLAELPASAAEYTKHAADWFWTAFHIFYNSHCDATPDESGYRFSAADSDEFLETARSMYWEIRNATPRFDPAYRTRKLTEARAKLAKVDYPLQRMLSVAVSAPTLVSRYGSDAREADC